MKQKFWIFLLINIFTLTACLEIDNDLEKGSTKKINIDQDEQIIKLKNELENLQKSGKLPKLDRSNSLLGPDKNNNGVRDDIEVWIAKKYPNQIPEAMQYAKKFQKIFSLDLKNENEITSYHKESNKASSCLFSRYDLSNLTSENPTQANPVAIATELEKITFNNKKRFEVYKKYNLAMNGRLLSIAPINESNCDE